jgi:hypothetical protein
MIYTSTTTTTTEDHHPDLRTNVGKSLQSAITAVTSMATHHKFYAKKRKYEAKEGNEENGRSDVRDVE